MANGSGSIDLAQLFQTVTGSLANQKQELNEADDGNHDHGDNMVDTFEVITKAMKEKAGADPADQLEYAAQLLRERKSGSSQMYAKGLEQASREYQGQQVTPDNIMTLVQSLLGGGQATQQQSPAGDIGGMLGSLLGGSGGQKDQQPAGGLDMGDLLQAGMSFMNTKQRGGSNLEAIVNAVVSSSAMGGGYRQQSSNLVASTLLQAVKGMMK